VTFLGTTTVLDVWEAGLSRTPAARSVLILEAAGADNVAEWPVGRRDRELALLAANSAGGLQATTTCPACGGELDVSFNPRVLPVHEPGPAITVADCGFRVVIRVPNAGDVADLPAGADERELRAVLLARCVIEADHDGQAVKVGALPAAVLDAVDRALGEADPGADIDISLECDECGAGWREQLDPPRFAWAAVEAAASRLATDVHMLARAYGWSEHEILKLSPFRRRLYLTAVDQ
jgi:hypothetical protein